MTDQPQYYQPLEVPRYVYLWEAVMWVGFGRFPEGSYLVTDGYPDEADYGYKIGTLSFNWKDAIFRQEYRFNGFWGTEASAAGLKADSADWDRYDEILRYHGYIRQSLIAEELDRLSRLPVKVDDGSELFKLETALSATFDKIDGGDRAHYRENLAKRLDEAPFIEDVHRLFQRHIDRVWVKLFQALTDGKMQSYGWRELSQDEIREEASGPGFWSEIINPYGAVMPQPDLIGPLQTMAVFDVIPVDEWSLTGFAPDAHYQSTSGNFWRDVVFPTDALFDIFPGPLLTYEAERRHIEHFTPHVAVSVETDLPMDTKHQRQPFSATRPGPGRRKNADGEVERACQALYGRRLAAGEKETPLHAEAMEFTMKVWGEPIARSTFQGYMKPFKPVPENTPDIAAE